MTYRNDPNRMKTVRSPEEVKRILMGGDPAADRPQSLSERPSGDDKLIATVLGEAEQYAGDRWSSRTRPEDLREFSLRAIFSAPTAKALTPDEYERVQAQSAGRCYSCGRACDCACGDDCIYCVDGVPRQKEGVPEQYAPPASR